MASSKDIRNRIKGVKSTRQITRAMQMVATSKMKKAQDSAKSGRPYALLLSDIIVSIADEFEEITHSYFIQKPIKHRGILVIGTDFAEPSMVTCFVSFLMLSIQQNLLRSENVRLSICPERTKIYLLILPFPISQLFRMFAK